MRIESLTQRVDCGFSNPRAPPQSGNALSFGLPQVVIELFLKELPLTKRPASQRRPIHHHTVVINLVPHSSHALPVIVIA